MRVLDMNEDFVSFSLAKKLTLKGFNAPCIAYYDEGILRYNTKYPFALTAEELLISHNSEYTWVDAPTISQVLKWLREEKKRHLLISTYHHTPFNVHDWGYDIINLRTYNVEHYDYGYNSYEESTLAGISYVLDNLI